MEWAAKVLTDYIIGKGMVEEEDRIIYEYGFTLVIEIGMFAIFCLLLSLYLHMFMKGILFFVIFAPLRSYAGGLHLKKYYSCFVLSCLTFCSLILLIRYTHVMICISLVALAILEIIVYILYPVENVNRKVDKEEDIFFRKKLKVILFIDMLIGILFAILRKGDELFLTMAIFFVVVITMLIGKHKKYI